MDKNYKALMISSSLVQDQEFIYPYYRLLEDNFKVDVFLLENKHVTGYFGTNIPPIKTHELINFDDIEVNNYDLLVLPGGVKSMEKLRLFKPALNLISVFNDKNITIACICSAVQLLISAKVVKGRKISGYYTFEDDVNNAGANYIDAAVVEDDGIITSPHYKYLGDWMKLIISKFND